MPTFGKVSLGGDESLVTLLLLIFSIGIGTGSLLCNRMLRGEINLTYVPYGALGISLFALELYFASAGSPHSNASETVGAIQFLSSWSGRRVLLDMFLIAVAGGIYIVPLNAVNAVIQACSERAHRARNIATVNIMNALFMVVSAIVSALLLALDFSVPELILILALFNLGAIFFTAKMR